MPSPGWSKDEPRQEAVRRKHGGKMENLIKIDKLSKSYHGKPVLKELSFSIPIGRITAVMAPSGAGKTTLLRILMGL